MCWNAMPLLAAIGVLAASLAVPGALGHGLGSDEAPSVSFEGMEVTVRTDITPYDFAAGEIDDLNMKIRFFDKLTDTSLEDVTYRVEVYQGTQLLARNLFFDVDGTLDVEVRPEGGCPEADLWKCTIYGGSEHPTAPGALYVQGEQCTDANLETCARPTIKGPVFADGGLFRVGVEIEGATSPRSQVANVLRFETFISVAQEQDFALPLAHAEEVPITIKTYYDDIANFAFDESDNSMTFDMDFDWNPEYVELVQVVHQEVRVPKSFEPYGADSKFKGYVNGVEVDPRFLLTDPYQFEDHNIIHFLMGTAELERINGILGPGNHENPNMNLRLVPEEEVPRSSTGIYLVDLEDFEQRVPTTVDISWDARLGPGQEVPFEIAFLSDAGQLIRDVRYSYTVIDGQEVILEDRGDDPQNPGILASEGIDVQRIRVPEVDELRIDVTVYGTGLDYDPTHSGIGSLILEFDPAQAAAPPAQEPPGIPAWVRQNAGWWADGTIDDAAFLNGIRFLAENGILVIPDAEQGEASGGSVPAWVRQNAGWWADGTIDDAAFLNGLQFLVREGILQVRP